MTLNLNRTENEIDRIQRQRINKNWEAIEKNFNNVVEVIGNEAFDKVVESARLIWQEPVNTFADLATTYPNAEVGWAAWARETVGGVSKAYRFDGTQWILYQEFNGDAINEVDNRLTERIDNDEKVVDDFAFNIRKLNVPLDGSVGIQAEIMAALNQYNHIFIPPNAVVGVTDTIVLNRGQSIISFTDNIRGQRATSTIKWIGPLDRHKTVIQVGANAVDAEPTVDASDIVVKNIRIDANNLAGFGMYGTYVTNESTISNVQVENALEYGHYYARSWYGRYNDLLARNCEGQGIAFGMPLEYLDGTSVTWSTSAPLEINNCHITNLRAHTCGRHFSQNLQGTYNPSNPAVRRKGYGIGFGVGNGFNAQSFVSERNGGAGIYVYTQFQPTKSISFGYLEDNCLNSGLLPESTMASIIIENTNVSGGSVEISNIITTFGSGGIYHTGVLGRKVWLRNVNQPRFLKSLDGLLEHQIYGEVLKSNVYSGAGLYNAAESLGHTNVIQQVNSKSSFTVPVQEWVGYKLVYVKGDGTPPQGSMNFNFTQGSMVSRAYPANLGTEYVLIGGFNRFLTSVTRGGAASTTDSNVTFKIINVPNTDF